MYLTRGYAREIEITIGSDTSNEESITNRYKIDIEAFDDDTPLIGPFDNVYEEKSMKCYGSAISATL